MFGIWLQHLLYDVAANYLVMEYVDGQDLRGPVYFDDALPIIQELIDGIEAAHEKLDVKNVDWQHRAQFSP